MTADPQIRCFLSGTKAPVHNRSPIWSTPFPLERDPVKAYTPDPDKYPITYGDYFTGARAFLEKDGFHALCEATHQQTESPVCAKDIASVDIRLEKHGEFYHPARIEIGLGDDVICCVLNVAISDSGKKAVSREYNLLRRLQNEYPWPYLPAAHALDRVTVNHGKIDMIMFLGQWFTGYHEFHQSGIRPDGKSDIVLWAEGERKFLAQNLVGPLYRQTSMILTCYYNLNTFEQISGWHHGAGDFIVSVFGNRLDVKLISVRQYAPMTDNKHQDPGSMIQSLLIFLLNLSLRMRVDRIEGVEELAWIDDRVVAATVAGFFDGMSQKAVVETLAEPFAALFKDYIATCTPDDFFDVAGAIVDSYHPQAPETLLIRKQLQKHCETLCRVITDGFH
jgi:hypothetical protein